MTALLDELKAARDRGRHAHRLSLVRSAVLAAWSEAISIAERHDDDTDGPYWTGFYRGTMSQPVWQRIVLALAVVLLAGFLIGLAVGRSWVS